MRYTNFVKSCIVLVSMLCLLLPFSAVASDDSASISAIQSDVSEILTAVNHALWDSGASADPYLKHIKDRQDAFTDQLGYFLTGRAGYEMDDSSFNFSNRNALPFWLNRLIYSLTGQNTTSANGPSDPRNLYDTITSVDSKQASANALLQSILDNLVAVTNSMAASSGVGGTNLINIVPTNIVNITLNGQDILAANPWWATNSGFYWTYGNNEAFPASDDSDSPTWPQFISEWSARLNLPVDRVSSSIRNRWYEYWGKDSINEWYGSGTYNDIPRYTWFDWITDAFRSNWVADTTFNARLLSSLRGISNAVDDSAEYAVNHLDYGIQDVTNLLGQVVNALVDAHGDNPWWWTNSAFATDWREWSLFGSPDHSVPRPYSQEYHTFPEVVSLLLSERQRFTFGESADSMQSSWGWAGRNVTSSGVYSFEDWLADFFRSNLTSSTYSSLTSEVDLAYTGVDDYPPTNSVLPDYTDLISEGDTSAASSSLQSGASTFEEQLTALSGMVGTQGDDEIVLIPEMTVGGIHVNEYRAHLATSITPVCRRIMQFIWAVSLFAALFSLAQSEWAFYANLGRTWTTSGGFHERDGP